MASSLSIQTSEEDFTTEGHRGAQRKKLKNQSCDAIAKMFDVEIDE